MLRGNASNEMREVALGQPFDCASPLYLHWLLPAAWSVSVVGRDPAGNVAAPQTYSWQVAYATGALYTRFLRWAVLQGGWGTHSAAWQDLYKNISKPASCQAFFSTPSVCFNKLPATCLPLCRAAAAPTACSPRAATPSTSPPWTHLARLQVQLAMSAGWRQCLLAAAAQHLTTRLAPAPWHCQPTSRWADRGVLGDVLALPLCGAAAGVH